MTDDRAHVVGKRLVASYGTGARRVSVLDGASFRIPRGRITVVTGPSGSGKTTILSLIGGMDVAEDGELLVDGRDLRALSPRMLSRYRGEEVGFVFQFFHLLPTLTALENVVAGLEPLALRRKERWGRAAEALESVGLGGERHRFPHQLSGGEQQRVAIARAWVKSPALMLADEPTGNLDAELGTQILDLLVRGPAAGPPPTLVVVTHDPEVARRGDQVLSLRGHHVVASADRARDAGAPTEVG